MVPHRAAERMVHHTLRGSDGPLPHRPEHHQQLEIRGLQRRLRHHPRPCNRLRHRPHQAAGARPARRHLHAPARRAGPRSSVRILGHHPPWADL